MRIKAKYEIIPVYIAGDGVGYSGEALKAWRFIKSPISRERVCTRCFSPVPTEGVLLEETRRGVKEYAKIDVAVLAMHGMHGEGMEPCRGCWSWRIFPTPAPASQQRSGDG